jgi:hypothetical protein
VQVGKIFIHVWFLYSEITEKEIVLIEWARIESENI